MSTIIPMLATALSLCEPFFEKETELYGFLDCDGGVAIPAKYHIAYDFTDGGIAAVLDKNGWYYISRTGDFVIRPKIFDNGPDYFSNGLARYIEDDKYGFFDTSGRVVIEAQFEFAFPFEDGKAKIGEDCQFVSHGEHTVVECETWSSVERPSSEDDSE